MIPLIHRKAVCSTNTSAQVSPPREDGGKAPQLWHLCQGCYAVVLAAGLAQGDCFPGTWTSRGWQEESKLLTNASRGDGCEGFSGHFSLSSSLWSMLIRVKPIFQSAFPVTGGAGPQGWERRKSPHDLSARNLLLPLLEAEDGGSRAQDVAGEPRSKGRADTSTCRSRAKLGRAHGRSLCPRRAPAATQPGRAGEQATAAPISTFSGHQLHQLFSLSGIPLAGVEEHSLLGGQCPCPL